MDWRREITSSIVDCFICLSNIVIMVSLYFCFKEQSRIEKLYNENNRMINYLMMAMSDSGKFNVQVNVNKKEN